MIPNRFIILWDNQPTGLDENRRIFKTDEPLEIKWWNHRQLAQNYINIVMIDAKVVEIQFRIMDS